jgi:hypothetical protein
MGLMLITQLTFLKKLKKTTKRKLLESWPTYRGFLIKYSKGN